MITTDPLTGVSFDPGDTANAVDVPAANPQGGILGNVSGSMASFGDAVAAIPRSIAQAASRTLTWTGETAGSLVGSTAASALSPLLPIVILLLVGVGLSIRLSGIRRIG